MALTSLIILRGPSVAGKSTVAKLVQEQAPAKIANYDYDFFREVVFKTAKKESGIARRELTISNVVTSAKYGFDAILELTLTTKDFEEWYRQLKDAYAGNIFIFYLEVSLEESKTRHLDRQKGTEFNAEHLEKWYGNNYKLGYENEYVIVQNLTPQEKADVIKRGVYVKNIKKD